MGRWLGPWILAAPNPWGQRNSTLIRRQDFCKMNSGAWNTYEVTRQQATRDFHVRCKGVVDESICRRLRFRTGTPITLADHQVWTFPAPTADLESASVAAEGEYLGLIHAILDSEDQSERRLAELALAIFLVSLNYQLSSGQLAELFSFGLRSPELVESQRAFRTARARSHPGAREARRARCNGTGSRPGLAASPSPRHGLDSQPRHPPQVADELARWGSRPLNRRAGAGTGQSNRSGICGRFRYRGEDR